MQNLTQNSMQKSIQTLRKTTELTTASKNVKHSDNRNAQTVEVESLPEKLPEKLPEGLPERTSGTAVKQFNNQTQYDREFQNTHQQKNPNNFFTSPSLILMAVEMVISL